MLPPVALDSFHHPCIPLPSSFYATRTTADMALTTTTTSSASASHQKMVVMREEDMDLIDIHNLIGSGSSAQVYLGKHTKLNLDMAVKLMKKDATTERGRKRIARARNEGLTMAALQHPNICKVYGTLETKKYVVLLLDFCKGGTSSSPPYVASLLLLSCFEKGGTAIFRPLPQFKRI